MTSRKSHRHVLRPKANIKFENMQLRTLERYRAAVKRFSSWLRLNEFSLLASLSDLDDLLGEFRICLYQDELPLGWASDVLSGTKRLYPRCRGSLRTTNMYHGHWQTAVRRVRALPLTQQNVLAIATCAILRKSPSLAVVMLVGFAALLRASEILSLEWRHFPTVSPTSFAMLRGHSEAATLPS